MAGFVTKRKKMTAMRLEQVQRFILAKKTFWGYGHFKQDCRYRSAILVLRYLEKTSRRCVTPLTKYIV